MSEVVEHMVSAHILMQYLVTSLVGFLLSFFKIDFRAVILWHEIRWLCLDISTDIPSLLDVHANDEPVSRVEHIVYDVL